MPTMDWNEVCTVSALRYKPMCLLGSIYAYDFREDRLISLPEYDQDQLLSELHQAHSAESEQESYPLSCPLSP